MPEQQAALKGMQKLSAEGAPLHAIVDTMKSAGVAIAHQSVKNALTAAGRSMSD